MHEGKIFRYVFDFEMAIVKDYRLKCFLSENVYLKNEFVISQLPGFLIKSNKYCYQNR